MKKILFVAAIFLLAQAACAVAPIIQTATAPPSATKTPNTPTLTASIPSDTPEAQPAPPTTTNGDGYPLAEGNYWIYAGIIAYDQNGSAVEETITWRVEVLEKVERQNVTGYRMLGSLHDLSFYTPDTTPSEYAIIQIDNRYYTADLDTFARLKDPDDLLDNLVSDYNLFLDLPLEAGSRFCETGQLTRDDGTYCWVVDAPTTSTYGQAYPLAYRTLGDVSQFTFVPGVGFIDFSYHHNGSTSDVNVQMTEYSIGE